MNATVSRRDDIALARGGARDLDCVIEIMNAAFDDRFGEAWTRSQCAGILPMPGVFLMIARPGDGSAAGFSMYRIIAGEAELLLLAVAPQFRRRGIGRILLDDFLAQAHCAGSSRVHLEVREGNEAILLYRRAGFTLAGRRRKYYRGRSGGEFDALTLVKTI